MYDRELDDTANYSPLTPEFYPCCGERERHAANCPKFPTETDDSVPHVHHVSEAVPWWAEAFPQWKGK